ncbi:hypothetical protein DFH28DRAFT_929402 [Melampsora americana]|nr:hypothetical protein DFH28DRAFT_929402 [Melampsora americana]
MPMTNPLEQIPEGTDVPNLMSRISRGFHNLSSAVEGRSCLNLGRGTMVMVHLYKNIAYYYALADDEKVSCYIFILDMSNSPGDEGIPCQVIIFGPSTSARVLELSFESRIIGRTVVTAEFVASYLERI